jgi:quinolinate synthase
MLSEQKNQLNEEQKQLIDKINTLKKQKNAIILAHNYLNPEIYEVADYLGDSLGLSKEAAKTNADIVLFCGVDFMAETAKILSPNKKVLASRKDATCPMAAMAGVEELKEMKKIHPDAKVVTYVNSAADVKAESDICCTSANALKIVESLPREQPIIFVPDRNLARYIQLTTARDIILWPGFCHAHHFITEHDVIAIKDAYPNAKVMAHPECTKQVLQYADIICSTEGMVNYAKKNEANEFIVLTEAGMVNRLKRDIPHKNFYFPKFKNEQAGYCHNMKKTTLQDVYDVLNEEKNEVNVSEDIAIKARKALTNMMDLS